MATTILAGTPTIIATTQLSIVTKTQLLLHNQMSQYIQLSLSAIITVSITIANAASASLLLPGATTTSTTSLCWHHTSNGRLLETKHTDIAIVAATANATARPNIVLVLVLC